MESSELEISALARVAAMFLDWATVPILAFPIPTRTSSGAFLRAFAASGGIPPEAGGLEAQPKTANNRQITAIKPIILFTIVLLNFFKSLAAKNYPAIPADPQNNTSTGCSQD
jgi:hypothetical protein